MADAETHSTGTPMSFSQISQASTLKSTVKSLYETFMSIGQPSSDDTVQYPSLAPFGEPGPIPGGFPVTPEVPPASLREMSNTRDELTGDELTGSSDRRMEMSPPRSKARSDVAPSPRRSNIQINPNNSPRPFSPESRRDRYIKNRSATPSATSEAASEDFINVRQPVVSSPSHRFPPPLHRFGHPLDSPPTMSEMLDAQMNASPDRTPMQLIRPIPRVGRSIVRSENEHPRSVPFPSRDIEMEMEMEMEMDGPTRPVTPTSTRPYEVEDVPPRGQSIYNPVGLSKDLQERFPILLVHAPTHERIWNRLAAGTRFMVALLALKYNVDLDKVPSSDLLKLEGSNHAMSQVLQIILPNRVISLDIEESELGKVADDLDWEAEQIVKGTGEMLGWREEYGTRYGGKIQFSATVKVDGPSTPGGGSGRYTDLDLNNHAKFTIEPPRFRGSCIFTRVFGSHRFLRVRMSSSIQSTVSVWCQTQEQREENQRTLREWARRPIVILGQVYSFLAEKDGTLIYFLEGMDNIGSIFEKTENYGIKECRTVPQLIDWWIPFEHNQHQTMSKLSTRLELGVSDTLPGILVRPEYVKCQQDIKNGKEMFTDGAGIMTPSVAQAMHRKYDKNISSNLPIAYQIRLQTAKGVLLVDPVMLNQRNFDRPHRVKLYESMVKAKRGKRPLRPGPVDGMHILDAACCILCIVKPAPSSGANGARLSSQFITVLSDRGVPDSIFLRLQEAALKKELQSWMDVTAEGNPGSRTLSQESRLKLARMIGRSGGFAMVIKKQELGGAAKGMGYGHRSRDRVIVEEDEQTEDEAPAPVTNGLTRFESFSSAVTDSGKIQPQVSPWSHNEFSGFPALKTQGLQDALLAGIDVVRSEYWLSIWKDLARSAMKNISTKFHLPIERSASGFFQPDPTGQLKEGEICFTPKDGILDSETSMLLGTITGDVIVGRHPALLPTDMRKVKAVENHILQDYRGIVFCSVRGSVSLATICAGGGHDGDEATVIWEPAIVRDFKNAPLSLRLPPDDFDERFRLETYPVRLVHERTVGLEEPHRSIEIVKYLTGGVGESDTFKIYNTFWNMAVYQDGLCGEMDAQGHDRSQASIMAHTFNKLMDSKKSGYRILPEIVKAEKLYWSRFDEPEWRQRQMETTAKGKGTNQINRANSKSLKSKATRMSILDQLTDASDTQIDNAMGQLMETLDTTDTKSDFHFIGNGMDRDLSKPWEEAMAWAKGDMSREREIQAIRTMVKNSQKELRAINSQFAKKSITGKQRTQEIRDLCQRFGEEPPIEEVPSFGTPVSGGETLRLVKASCAYYFDMTDTRRGGSENGFPWILAMKDLCAIKARALSGDDTFTMPRGVRDRMEVHSYWA
ncbi:hypothetical protein CPB86DRAFT_740750 [Serendipita vermifera]|nr:hypothetical protein CPB86DRAFT_740750 [Serendipita vermifera]